MAKHQKTQRYRRLLTILKELRIRGDLTQVELAKKLGKPQSYVSKYEAGERALDLLELENVCTATGSSLTSLIALFEGRDHETK